MQGAQWLSGRLLVSRPRAGGLGPTGVTVLCPLARPINPSLVLVQPKKTCPYITERLLMGCKESNQTNKQNKTKGQKNISNVLANVR